MLEACFQSISILSTTEFRFCFIKFKRYEIKRGEFISTQIRNFVLVNELIVEFLFEIIIYIRYSKKTGYSSDHMLHGLLYALALVSNRNVKSARETKVQINLIRCFNQIDELNSLELRKCLNSYKWWLWIFYLLF